MKTQDQIIAIPCLDTYEFIKLNEVVRCEGSNNNSRVYLLDGNILKSTHTIGAFKQSLAEYDFFCCHKSHVINTQHIARYFKEGFVELNDGSTVPVSRRRKEDFISNVIGKYNLCALNQQTLPKKFKSDPLYISNE